TLRSPRQPTLVPYTTLFRSAKIGLIKRDMTKLGAGREVGVVWRNEWVALWRHGQPTPEGYEPNQRIRRERVPKCPTCGCAVMQRSEEHTSELQSRENLVCRL